uniref:F-box domain-containing protein n=1 Tax=Strongyloides venezuelensis TaxID=75913 RepID=A0A0K0G302_STRVS
MDLITLPEEYQLQIFEKLHWKDINNLKLVCKNFYFTVVKNIEKLDRPKMDYLHLYYTEDGISRVRYAALKHTENILTSEKLNVVEIGYDCEYESFLRDKNFTEIKILVFENTMNGESICIRDSEYYIDESVDDISTFYVYDIFFNRRYFCDVDNYRFHIHSFSGMLGSLTFTISSSEKLIIPYNDSVLRREFLRKWGLFKRNESHLFMKKITMDVITGNPLLEYGNTSNDSPAFIQVTNHIYELRLFNLENLCNRKPIQLTFRVEGGFTALDEEFYREFSDKIKLNSNFVIEGDGNTSLIESSDNCSKCGVKHENAILCIESLETGYAYIKITLTNSILPIDM